MVQPTGISTVAGKALIGGPEGVGHVEFCTAPLAPSSGDPVPGAVTGDTVMDNGIPPKHPAKRRKVTGLRPGGMGIDRATEAEGVHEQGVLGEQGLQAAQSSGRPPQQSSIRKARSPRTASKSAK